MEIQLDIVDAGGNPVFSLLPDCYAGQAEYPVIVDIAASGATFSLQTSANGHFFYQVTTTNPELIDMYVGIYLDCNLIPHSGGSLFLQQKYIVNTVPIVTSAPIRSPITYPTLVAPPSIGWVDGYYGEQNVELLFAYVNTGTSDVHMEFEFNDVSTCAGTGYEVVSVEVAEEFIGTSPSTFIPYLDSTPFENTAELDINEVLYIKQIINITGCVDPCMPKVEFRWRCTDRPIDFGVFCEECETPIVTQFNFTTEVPTFEIIRLDPDVDNASYDNSCPGDATDWEIKVINTSAYTTIPEIKITTFQDLANSFTLISEADADDADITNCPTCSTNVKHVDPLTSQVACSSVSDPLASFDHTVTNIGPGEYFTYTFKTIRCCDENVDFFNQEKLFNHWKIEALATSACNTQIEHTIASSDPVELVSPSGISTHEITSEEDIHLNCSLVADVASMVIDPDVEADSEHCNGRFSLYKSDFQVTLNGLAGDNSDLQVFGYNPTGGEVNLILRVRIHCETGLLIDDSTDVYITSFNNSSVWEQIPESYHHTNVSSGTLYCCQPADYFFYFDLRSLMGTPVDLVDNYLDNGILNFKFRACCEADPTTLYSIEFSVLMNDECYEFEPGEYDEPACGLGDCCWLPLSATGYQVHVHCPGCQMPGAIVDNAYIRRITFGFEDATNDGVADNTTVITPGGYSEFNKVNKNAAVFGDVIEDKLVGHFEPGYDDGTVAGGYTYTNMMTNKGIEFKALQLHKEISVFSGINPAPDPIALTVTGFDFYVDAPVTSGTCEQCSGFDQAATNLTTILHLGLSNTDVEFTDFFDATLTNDEMLFTFLVDDVNNAGPDFYNSYTTFSGYEEDQQYRIAVRYEVCGNFQPDNPLAVHIDNLDRERLTEINNTLFFNGDGLELGDVSGTDKAPNSLDDLHGFGLEFTGYTVVCPGLCDDVDQGNFANEFLFYCEKYATAFTFYSTEHFNKTAYFRNGEEPNCTMEVQMHGISRFNHTNNATTFRYEYKPPSLFPMVYEFKVPENDFFVPLNTSLNDSVARFSYFRYNSGNSAGYTSREPITFTVTGTDLIHVEPDPQEVICIISGAIPNNSVTDLAMSDEFSQQTVSILLRPKDCDLEVGPNGTLANQYPDDDSQITFNENTTSCSINNSACEFSEVMDNIAPNSYFPLKNPNLQLAVEDNGVILSAGGKPEVCWNYTFTNPQLLPPAQTGTAYNIYLALPVNTVPGLTTFFSNWQVTYNIQQNLTDPGTSGSSMMNANGIFYVSDSLLANAGAVIHGTICAEYTCSGGLTFPLTWGWNCDGIPDTINSSVCQAETYQLEIQDAPVELVEDPTANPLSSYTLCDDFVLSACYKSQNIGQVRPDNIELTGLPITGLTLVGDPVMRDCSGSSTTANPLANDPPFTWTITPAELFEVGIGDGDNGLMEITNCICIDWTFTPECGYDGTLPSVVLHGQSYCSEEDLDVTVPIDFAPLVPNGSVCNSCYTIYKFADSDTVLAEVEQMVWYIEVCSYNDPLNYPDTVTVSDVFPPGFTWTSGDLEFGGPQAVVFDEPGCITLTVFGTMDSVGTWCNTAYLYYIDSNNDTIAISDTACVVVTENCNPLADETVMMGTTYASSFGTFPPTTVPGATVVINGKLIVDVDMLYFQNQTLIMGPQAEIEVQPNQMLVLDSCDVYACRDMWRGVVMQDSSVVVIYNSRVQDAHKTVDVADHCIVGLLQSEFIDNFITVYAKPVSGAANSSMFIIEDNMFRGTGVLNPKYTNQENELPQGLTSFDEVPLGAFVVSKCYINFNNPLFHGSGYNKFRHMSNGIIGIKSAFNIEYCRFDTIQPAPVYTSGTFTSTLSNFNGSGVYALTGVSGLGITQKGFGNLTSDLTSFKNCNYGIFADKISLVSEYNHMTDVNTAHRAQLVTSDIYLRYNRLYTNKDAVQLFMNDGSDNTIVYDNDIEFGNNDAGAAYSGIRVEEAMNQNHNSRINYNRIQLRPGVTAAARGIFVQAANRFIISNNDVRIPDNTTSLDGIAIHGGDRVWTVCNYIKGSGDYDTLNHQAAISNFIGDSPFTICNNVDSTNNGIYVLGAISSSFVSAFAGNDLHNHTYAFRYSMNASVATSQDFMGNRWHEPEAIVDGFNARNENSSYINIFVNDFTDPLAIPGSQDPFDWFQPGGDPNFLCIDNDTLNPLNVCVDYFPTDCPQCRSEMEEEIAMERIENEPYTEETRWMMKQGLYQKIDEYPELLSDTLLSSFYNNNRYIFIGSYKGIKDSKKELFIKDSSFVQNLAYNSNLVKSSVASAMSSINQLVDLAVTGEYPGTDLSTIRSYQVAYRQAMEEAESLVNSLDAAKYYLADEIETTNNSLNTENLIESNFKTVESIYLASVPKQINALSAQQIGSLKSIAQQCPMVGGPAVFLARSLYSLYDATTKYDDHTTCNREGSPLRVKPKNSIPISANLYPNPANTEVTLDFDLGENSSGLFSMFNTQSQPVFDRKLTSNRGKHSFNIELLAPGVYYFRISNEKDQVLHGKLVIIR